MKQLFLGFLLLFTLTTGKANAQKINPAKWSWTLSKPNPAVGETVDVIFTITTDKTWHHFASDFDPNVGPIVTTIKFKPSDSFELVGNLKSINPIKKHDEIFDGDVSYFEGKGELRQTIKILKENRQLNNRASYYNHSRLFHYKRHHHYNGRRNPRRQYRFNT